MSNPGAFISFFICVLGLYPLVSASQPVKLADYKSVAVLPVTVDQTPATRDFPNGLDTVLRDRLAQQLQKSKMFQRVAAAETPPIIPASPPQYEEKSTATAPVENGSNATSEPALVIKSTVLKFDKGSTAGRFLVGFGAGKSKITVLFVVADARTGTELMRVEQKATWNGMTSLNVGTADEAAHGAVNNAVKDFIAEMVKRHRS